MGRRKIRPLDAPHVDCARRKLAPQILAEIPFRARPAAENVEAKRMILGKGVAGKVRFRKQTHARDAARSGKLMESGVAYGMKEQGFREPSEKGTQLREISQRRRVTTVRFNHPLAAAHGLLLGASALGAELGGARHGLAAVDAEFRGGFAASGSGGVFRRRGPWRSRGAARPRVHRGHPSFRPCESGAPTNPPPRPAPAPTPP